jgi:hypothetical protein
VPFFGPYFFLPDAAEAASRCVGLAASNQVHSIIETPDDTELLEKRPAFLLKTKASKETHNLLEAN